MGCGTVSEIQMRAEVLRLDDPGEVRRWAELVDSSPNPDSYYRPGYARACETAGHGKALGLLLETSSVRALLPILLRPLSSLAFCATSDLYDVITPYGYGGLLLLSEVDPPSPAQFHELFLCLQQWCKQAKVISCLVRLHPLLHQSEWFSPLAQSSLTGLSRFGATTALDLSQWDSQSDSLATMNKGRLSDLTFARRHLQLTWAFAGDAQQENASLGFSESLRMFYSLYEQSMDRLQASSFYHFSYEYYLALAEGLGSNLGIALAWLSGEAVGASMFMADRRFGHYHLSATNGLGRAHKAGTLLVTAGARWARSRGCRWLHLGGGTRPSDSLYAFKRSFGGTELEYAFLSFVPDWQCYQKLVQLRTCAPDLPAPREDFFPVYRA
jgi:serine/alanine adding enzyme